MGDSLPVKPLTRLERMAARDAADAKLRAQLETFKEHGCQWLADAWVSLSLRAQDASKQSVEDKLVNVMEAIATGSWRNPNSNEVFNIKAIAAAVQEKYREGVADALNYNRIKLAQIADQLGLAGKVLEPGPMLQPKKNKKEYYIESVVCEGKSYAIDPVPLQSPEKKGKDRCGDIKNRELPGPCFAGVFGHQRLIDDFLQSTGLYPLDFDHVKDIDTKLARIASDPCVFAVFKSPTGTGLKPIVYGPKTVTAAEYSAIYDRVCEYAVTAWEMDAKFDSNLRDPSRLCYFSYDPNVCWNYEAMPLAFNAPPAPPEPVAPIPPVPAPETTALAAAAPQAVAPRGISDEDDLLEAKKEIAEDILGEIAWDYDDGICICPNKAAHTPPDNDDNDCHVHLNHQSTEDQPATIYCHHNGCQEKRENPDNPVTQANHELRSKIGKLTFARSGVVKVNRPGQVMNNGHVDEEKVRKLIEERMEAKPAYSLVYWSKQPIDPALTIMGDRFWCLEGGLVLGAPTGVGKSSAAHQMQALLGAGLEVFGIPVRAPQRVLMVQAENDIGDTIEMSSMVNHLKLTTEQLNLVDQNTKCMHINDMSGDGVLAALDYKLSKWPATVVIIEPLNSFSGCDPSDTEGMMNFLRHGLNPLMSKHKCAVIVTHHSPKTRNWDTDKWKPHEFVYAVSGNNEISNWCRAMIYIDPTHVATTFRFIAAKRGKRIGWKDGGQFEFKRYFVHSPEGILWLPATMEQEIEAEQAKKQNARDARARNGSDVKYSEDLLLGPILEGDAIRDYADLHAALVRSLSSEAPDKSTVHRRWDKMVSEGKIYQNEKGYWNRKIS